MGIYLDDLLPSVESADMDGLTMLEWAARQGYQSLVQTLITLGKANINPKSQKSEMKPLSLALQYGHSRVVRLLLHEYEVNTEWRWLGVTLPQWAANVGDAQLVESLLTRNNINVSSRDPVGRSPLHFAIDQDIVTL
jgi:ankyrin repeat protein